MWDLGARGEDVTSRTGNPDRLCVDDEVRRRPAGETRGGRGGEAGGRAAAGPPGGVRGAGRAAAAAREGRAGPGLAPRPFVPAPVGPVGARRGLLSEVAALRSSA